MAGPAGRDYRDDPAIGTDSAIRGADPFLAEGFIAKLNEIRVFPISISSCASTSNPSLGDQNYAHPQALRRPAEPSLANIEYESNIAIQFDILL